MATNKPVIRLNLSQIGQAAADAFLDFLSDQVSPERALALTIQKIAGEEGVAKVEMQTALTEVAKFVHPKTSEGTIADLEQNIKDYTAEGQRDAAELKKLQSLEKLTMAEKRRMAALPGELQRDAAAVRRAQEQLETEQANYARAQRVYESRWERYIALKKDRENLVKEGPTLIRQVNDARRLKQQEEEEAKRQTSTHDNAESVLDGLRQQADEAGRYQDAVDIADEREREESHSLDSEISAHNEAMANDALIQGWLSNEK